MSPEPELARCHGPTVYLTAPIDPHLGFRIISWLFNIRKKYDIQKLNLFSKRDICGTAWINHWLHIVCTCFHCNSDNFRMFEARESETEIEQHVIEVYDIHLRLKNWRTMGVKVLCRRRIQVSSNLEQEAMSWVIHKNLVELEITYIRDYL